MSIVEPEAKVRTLLKHMSPVLSDEVFVFAHLGDFAEAQQAIMVFRELEGFTAILERSYAEQKQFLWKFPCKMITLQAYSGLDTIGFLGTILPRLAELGIATNVVSAFHHDHFFVPENKAEETMTALVAISSGQV